MRPVRGAGTGVGVGSGVGVGDGVGDGDGVGVGEGVGSGVGVGGAGDADGAGEPGPPGPAIDDGSGPPLLPASAKPRMVPPTTATARMAAMIGHWLVRLLGMEPLEPA